MTPPHRAIRSWTQLLIAGRLNLVCHQIPVGGRDGDVVQRAMRPPHRQRLTPTEASSRKWQQKFAVKPEASPLSALSLLSRENWLGGNLNAPRCSTQNENVSAFFFKKRFWWVIWYHLCFPLTHLWFPLAHAWHWWVENHVVSQQKVNTSQRLKHFWHLNSQKWKQQASWGRRRGIDNTRLNLWYLFLF